MTVIEILLLISGLFTLLGLLSFALVSIQEKHNRAGRISLLLGLLTIALYTILILAPTGVQIAASILIAAIFLAGIILLLWPARKTLVPSPPPDKQVDERTIIFARARLEPGTERYHNYYREHPEHQPVDDAFRAHPGLLTTGSAFYNEVLATSPEGGFFLTESLRDAVDGPISANQVRRSPEQMAHFVKNLAGYHGAVDVGICKLQPYHIYSHIGRGSGVYGAPVTLDHAFAIAFTVEMSHEMITSAPRMPAVMESAHQYASAGAIAVILAAAIRSLGYPARAHIDGNYRVIAPLVAKDAGLGEIGRMGLLMTPRLGPRVRLAVVTTDLPLIPDPPTFETSVLDFCTSCKKCAAVCPSQAIPFGDRSTHPDGTLRWKIDAERCYTYWTRVGTDCGRCMAVCPYSHPDTIMHNLVRFGVKHSSNFRRAAAWMDDLFYGKIPLPHKPPDWIADAKNDS